MVSLVLETYAVSDPAHKFYSKHAPIESVKTKKKQKINHCLRQEINKNKVQLSHEAYM